MGSLVASTRSTKLHKKLVVLSGVSPGKASDGLLLIVLSDDERRDNNKKNKNNKSNTNSSNNNSSWFKSSKLLLGGCMLHVTSLCSALGGFRLCIGSLGGHVSFEAAL